MMDVACCKCGELTSLDSLHLYAEETRYSFDEVFRSWRAEGCSGAGMTCSESGSSAMAAAASLFADLAGDDVDFLASMVEDYDLLMGL